MMSRDKEDKACFVPMQKEITAKNQAAADLFACISDSFRQNTGDNAGGSR